MIDLEKSDAMKRVKKTIQKKTRREVQREREIKREEMIYEKEETKDEDLGFDLGNYEFEGDVKDLEKEDQEFQNLEEAEIEQTHFDRGMLRWILLFII